MPPIELKYPEFVNESLERYKKHQDKELLEKELGLGRLVWELCAYCLDSNVLDHDLTTATTTLHISVTDPNKAKQYDKINVYEDDRLVFSETAHYDYQEPREEFPRFKENQFSKFEPGNWIEGFYAKAKLITKEREDSLEASKRRHEEIDKERTERKLKGLE